MNMENFKTAMLELYTGSLKPAAERAAVWSKDTALATVKVAKNVAKDSITPHGRGKVVEVMERSLQTVLTTTQVLAEAVLDLNKYKSKEDRHKYHDPWKGFSWSGPVDLTIFGYDPDGQAVTDVTKIPDLVASEKKEQEPNEKQG